MNLHRYDFKIIKSLFTVSVCYAFLKDKNKKKKISLFVIQYNYYDWMFFIYFQIEKNIF